MQLLSIFSRERPTAKILALGAHADDIELGCGGTLLRLAAETHNLEVLWVVFCSTPERAIEAEASATAFLDNVARKRISIRDYRDGYLPYTAIGVKEEFEKLKQEFDPDLIFTHYREDRHQDHRLISDLTWNTWRNHLILEYEIPKYDGDLGNPNFFFQLTADAIERKIQLILQHFPSQAHKPWFSADLLRGLARVRGLESAAPERLAEGFYCRKASI